MSKTLHAVYISLFFIVGILSVVLLTVNGFNYYITPLDERFFAANHEMLKPSGIIGHGLGIVGSLMMVLGVAVYMIRKRVRKFVGLGLLKHWLEFHIFLCTVGPILVLYHTAFKFGGLVAVSFWSMVAVVISGVIGKFIYVQIPRTIQGRELDIKELNEINDQLTLKLRRDYCVSEEVLMKIEELSSVERYNKISLMQSLNVIASEYFTTRLILRRLKKEIRTPGRDHLPESINVIKDKLILSRRIGLYRSMQKLFKYWHVAHLPFAMVMFFIMVVHIAVTILFGYKWVL